LFCPVLLPNKNATKPNAKTNITITATINCSNSVVVDCVNIAVEGGLTHKKAAVRKTAKKATPNLFLIGLVTTTNANLFFKHGLRNVCAGGI